MVAMLANHLLSNWPVIFTSMMRIVPSLESVVEITTA